MANKAKHKTTSKTRALVARDYFLRSPEFAKPVMTEFSEAEIIGRKLRERARIDEAATGRRWTRTDWVKHAKEYSLSSRGPIKPRMALAMMTIYSPPDHMNGGRPSNPRKP
jgi:hypothetical protein